MEIKVGQYIKLGRVCFKIKETSSQKEILRPTNQVLDKSASSVENTNALISGEDCDEAMGMAECKQFSSIISNFIDRNNEAIDDRGRRNLPLNQQNSNTNFTEGPAPLEANLNQSIDKSKSSRNSLSQFT